MRVLGLDVGGRRVGLAISDVSGTLARPLRTLVRTGSMADLLSALVDEIHRLQAEEDGLGGIVVGLPARLDGTPTEQTARVVAFAETLGASTTLSLSFQDERLSSREAESRLALRERDWRKRKPRLDAAAAAVILQDYLDDNRKR